MAKRDDVGATPDLATSGTSTGTSRRGKSATSDAAGTAGATGTTGTSTAAGTTGTAGTFGNTPASGFTGDPAFAGTSGTAGTTGTTGASFQGTGTDQGWQGQQGQQPGATQQMKDEVKGLANQAKEETKKLAGQARGQVEQLVTQQRDQVAVRLGSVAGALRDVGRKLQEEDQGGFGRYADQAAQQVDKLSNYLREKDLNLNSLVRDTETLARRRPELFLGGTFLAGLLLARFLKASAPDTGYGQPSWNEFAGTAGTGTSSFDTTRSTYTPERRNPDDATASGGYETYNAPLGV
jgi:hypothetical protein